MDVTPPYQVLDSFQGHPSAPDPLEFFTPGRQTKAEAARVSLSPLRQETHGQDEETLTGPGHGTPPQPVIVNCK